MKRARSQWLMILTATSLLFLFLLTLTLTGHDLLHIFSFLPRELNLLEHTSNIGWKENQRARPVIIDPGLYHSMKSGVFRAKEGR